MHRIKVAINAILNTKCKCSNSKWHDTYKRPFKNINTNTYPTIGHGGFTDALWDSFLTAISTASTSSSFIHPEEREISIIFCFRFETYNTYFHCDKENIKKNKRHTPNETLCLQL
jgi:hypothetical protein